MTEFNRLLRHGVAPLTAWLVAAGHLPEYMRHDVTEAIVLLIGVLFPIAASWARDQSKP